MKNQDMHRHTSHHSQEPHNHDHHTENSQHGHAGHDHHRMMIVDFKKRFWVSLLLSVPVLVLSPMIQGFFGFELTFAGSFYVLFALASLIFFYGGWPFLKGLKDEIGAPQFSVVLPKFREPLNSPLTKRFPDGSSATELEVWSDPSP